MPLVLVPSRTRRTTPGAAGPGQRGRPAVPGREARTFSLPLKEASLVEAAGLGREVEGRGNKQEMGGGPRPGPAAEARERERAPGVVPRLSGWLPARPVLPAELARGREAARSRPRGPPGPGLPARRPPTCAEPGHLRRLLPGASGLQGGRRLLETPKLHLRLGIFNAPDQPGENSPHPLLSGTFSFV